MDSTEFNKIAGAGLAALLIFLLLNFFSGQIYGTRDAAHGNEEEMVLAYALAVETEAPGEAEEPEIDLAALVANADPAAGESGFRACTACHNLEDGANAVGPHLHDVVGREIAGVDGYAYSDALMAIEGVWDLENLSGFLADPRGWAPGTKMSFAGIRDAQARVNVIAYLNEATGTPIDLAEGLEPVAAAEDAATEETAADAVEAVAPDAVTESITEDKNVGGEVTERTVVPTEDADVPAPDVETHSPAPTGEPPVAVTDPTPEAPVQQEPQAAGPPGEGAEPLAGAPEAVDADRAAERPGQPEEPSERIAGEQAPPQSPPGEPRETDPLRQLQAEPDGATAEQAPADEESAAPQAPAEGQPATADAPAGEEQQMTQATQEEAGPAFEGGDAAAGETVFRRCAACHRLGEGQHGVGPSLHGVVGREIGGLEDYNYSDAMANYEGEWTPENLSTYLENPKAMIPGTKMAFPGLRNEQDRINVITYLDQASQ